MGIDMWLPLLRVVGYHPNIYNHVVLEILIPCDEGVSAIVLEANAVGGTLVESIEVLYCGDNRVSCIMGKYLHPHW